MRKIPFFVAFFILLMPLQAYCLREVPVAVPGMDKETLKQVTQSAAVDFYNRGVEALKLGSLDDAISSFSKALELDPQDHLAYNNRGVAYKRKGLYDEAIADYNRALEIKPGYDSALFNRGTARYNKGDVDGAMSDLIEAQKKRRNDSIVATTLGMVYRDKGELDKAAKELRRGITLNKKNLRAYQALADVSEKQRDFEEAIRNYAKVMDLVDKGTDTSDLSKKIQDLRRLRAQDLHMQGLENCRDEKLNKAIDLWTAALKIDPNMVPALRDRGLTRHKTGNYKKAVEDFSAALEIAPANAELYRVRADSYYRLKEPEKALQDYDKALELNPRDAIGYNNRGLVYHEKGEIDKAIADYSRAIAIDASNPTFVENRALILLSRGKTKEALEDYQKALEVTTDEKLKSRILDKVSAIREQSGAATSADRPAGDLPSPETNSAAR